MEPNEDLLPEAKYGPEVEREATAPPRSIGMALLAGGALGLVMSAQQPGLKLRERLFAAGGSAMSIGLGVLATRGPLSLSGPARKAPLLFASGCYGSAAASAAFGGGHMTPAYFPAVVLTALGGGVGANLTAGRRGGAAVASVYLAGCAGTLKPWRSSLQRESWWNVAGALGFVGAGIVGAIAGDLNLKMRALTDFADREAESSGRAEMEEAAAKVRELGRDFLELLKEVDKAFEHDPAVSEAAVDLTTALGTLRTVRTIPPSEEWESLATWPRLREIAEGYNSTGGNVRVSLATPSKQPPSANAAITSALCESATALIQNSANARPPKQAQVEVRITLDLLTKPRDGRRRRMLRMTVEDDAGGTVVPRTEWGTGLSEALADAQELGGDFRLEQGDRGLRAVFEALYVHSHDDDPHPLTFRSEAAAGRDACLRELRWVTATQAIFIAFSESARKDMPRRLALIGGFYGAGELVQRLPEKARARAAAPLGALAMSAFRGPGRPLLGGWSAVMCAQAGASGKPKLGWLAGVGATVGATAAAGPERFSSALPTTIGDRTFALLGAAVGASVWKGLLRLEEQEEKVANETWRRRAQADLAAPERLKHHLLKPVKGALGKERWDEFKETNLGKRIENAEGDLHEAQGNLERLLTAGNPLRELQHQLAHLLAPAPVRVLGEWPKRTDPQPGHELEAVRYRLGLIGLGQALAVRVLDNLPSKFFFPQRLQELQIHVGPGQRRTRFTIVQVPFEASGRDRADAIVDVASRRAGGKAGGRIGNNFDVWVHNTALR
jgi:hypothetical protein